MESTNELEPSFNLLLNYSHHLKRTAFNMIWGQFGKLGGKKKQLSSNFVYIYTYIHTYISIGSSELICVQSMDGQLSFFHYDSATFTCFLPEFLLPGPLGYIPQTDSLVTVNSSHILQVFKYVMQVCVFLHNSVFLQISILINGWGYF